MMPDVGIWARASALVLGILALSIAPSSAATVPSGFTETLVASGLSRPTAMTFAPDGRMFVCQQDGQLRIVKDGALLSTPFLTVTVSSSGERGLLGVALDPDFALNNFVYVYYTATLPQVHNRVSRFTASGDVAVAGSEVVLLDLNPLSNATNHNGGALHFGPDGKLYIAVGENASGSNAQTLSNLLGKILRINADGSIPTDNPFYRMATGVNRAIWALGLRNPFTFSIHPSSSRMLINDVGQSTWEEINEGIAGANYGWPATEGPTSNPAFKAPLYSYGQGTGPFVGCAITGGAFYHGLPMQFPADYLDDYFFADICGGWINRLDSESGAVAAFASRIAGPVDLAIGPDGSLYYLARGAGSVVRVTYTASRPPAITQHPASQVVLFGQPATFTVAASGTAPLAYQWQRNGENIPGATASTFTLPASRPADGDAQFRCVVSNAFGTAISNGAVLTVVPNGGSGKGTRDRLPKASDFETAPVRQPL